LIAPLHLIHTAFAFCAVERFCHMASRSALITLLVAVSCAAVASATSYTVGDNQGWTTGVDYSGWTRGKNFVVGDKLGEPCVHGELLYVDDLAHFF
jgi:hypothetical protein